MHGLRSEEINGIDQAQPENTGGVLVPAPPVGFRKVGATLTALVEGHYLIASTDACLCRSPVRWLMGLNDTVVDADAGQLARAFLGRQILPVSRAQSRS